MRNSLTRASLCLFLGLFAQQFVKAPTAWADPSGTSSQPATLTPQEGEIVSSHSRWGYGQSAIVTESVLQRLDGSQVVIHQLGGSVEGLSMRVSHHPAVLQVGDRVAIDTTSGQSLSGKRFVQLNEIRSRHSPTLGDKYESSRDFVRAANTNNTAIFWLSGCAFINTATEGSQDIAGDTEFQVIDEVLKSWQNDTRSCSQFELINDGKLDSEVGLDGVNLIKFRETRWCRPATDDDPEKCHEEAAAGITTIFFNNKSSSGVDGSIVDADIELNSVNFAFAVNGQSNGNEQCQSDLANTLAHEMGHFLGLSHTCRLANDPPTDSFGVTIPLCTQVSTETAIIDATMYNFQRCAETKKASLESDDIAGMCSIYPSANHPGECKRATLGTGGCCAVAGNKAPTPPLALLLLLCLPVFLLRRRWQQ